MATSTMDEAIAIDLSNELVPCDICGRTFLPTPLKKHLVVCERNATRKRKVFDSLKQRVQGTDLAPFVQNQRNVPKCDSQSSLTAAVHVATRAPVVAAVASTISISANESDEQHNNSKPEEMVDRMRPTKAPKKASPRRSISSVGKMGVTERCPHCERQFGVKAFDRHVEWCKEHKTRIVRSPASVVQAKERLEARTKYRVPPLNKSKRSVTREKYAPGTGGINRAESQISVDSTSSVDLAKKPQKLPVNEPQFENIRQLTTTDSNKSTKEDYDPFIVAEKQLLELLQCDDFKPFNNTYPLTAPTSRPATNSSSKKLNSKPIKTTPIKRASVIEPPLDFSDKMCNLQDNFEFIENFINDNYIPPDKLKETKTKTELKQNGLCLNLIFSDRKYSDDLNIIDPSLINENDNLTIPDKLLVDNYSPDHYSVQYDKKIAVLEPIVLAKTETLKRSMSVQNEQSFDDIDDLISSFDDDESFPTLKSFLQSTKADTTTTTPKQIQRSTLSLNSSIGRVKSPKKSPDSKRSLPALSRSVSLINPVVKARSMKNKQDIQDYLHVSDTKTKKTTDKHKKDTTKIAEEEEEELYPKDHAMYEEYKKYEKEYRMEEQRKNAGNGDIEVNNYEEPSYERKIKSTTKLNADSAYGSLNRNSSQVVQPRLHTRHTISKHNSVERSPSSSGSETSMTTPVKLQPAIDQRMSKFCHECGTKYPLNTAKFCIECGIRRLIL